VFSILELSFFMRGQLDTEILRDSTAKIFARVQCKDDEIAPIHGLDSPYECSRTFMSISV
jgi:hypothetical protein